MPLEAAGPLFCGGVTTFSPFVDFDVKPWHRVGVVGVGGLGHLALQWANKWGCEVTAISSSSDKEEAARRLGAHRFCLLQAGKPAPGCDGLLDFIVVTAPANFKVPVLLNMLKRDGRLCYVAASGIKCNSGHLFSDAGQAIMGSNTGSLQNIRRMMDFAGRHHIWPMVEVVPVARINEALDKVRQNQTRYRMVVAIGA